MPTMQSSIMPRLIGRIRAVGKDRKAAAAVELALAMPALCLFIFGIIEVSFALWVQNALDYWSQWQRVAPASMEAPARLSGVTAK